MNLSIFLFSVCLHSSQCELPCADSALEGLNEACRREFHRFDEDCKISLSGGGDQIGRLRDILCGGQSAEMLSRYGGDKLRDARLVFMEIAKPLIERCSRVPVVRNENCRMILHLASLSNLAVISLAQSLTWEIKNPSIDVRRTWFGADIVRGDMNWRDKVCLDNYNVAELQSAAEADFPEIIRMFHDRVMLFDCVSVDECRNYSRTLASLHNLVHRCASILNHPRPTQTGRWF